MIRLAAWARKFRAEQLSGENHPNFDATIYELENIDGSTFKGTRYEFSQQVDTSAYANFHLMFQGRAVNGWYPKGERPLIGSSERASGGDHPNAVSDNITLYNCDGESVRGPQTELLLELGVCSARFAKMRLGKRNQVAGWGLDPNWPECRPSHLRRVVCLDTGKMYDTISEAAQHVGSGGKSISAVCQQKRISAGGRVWAYAEDVEGLSEVEMKRVADRRRAGSQKGKAHPSMKPVVCLETRQVFESQTVAAKASGAQQGHISAVLRGERLRAAGYHWAYLSSVEALSDEQIDQLVEDLEASHSRRSRWANKDDVLAEAHKYDRRSDFLKYASGAYKAASGEGYLDEACAHMADDYRRWTHKENVLAEAKKYRTKRAFRDAAVGAANAAYKQGWWEEATAHMVHPRWKPVVCLDTGATYESPKAAARATGTRDYLIRAVCVGKQKTAGGYHWVYADD